MMHGRRWSDGLHQAVEAKEGVNIQQESKTWATVTFQNYFRMYKKLAGMTGTAQTEAEEFKKIYDLDVISIPTNEPIARTDHPDLIYKTQRAKYAAVAVEVEKCYKKGQPVLIGTTSIENNEIVGTLLKRKGVPHQILNAKNHQKEATIIAKAGKKKSITVATNMAGRGVDIILGGQPPEDTKENKEALEQWKKEQKEVLAMGGLHVVGTERHESRRIDNQLRGRGGRQGDPGSSRFFVALDDNLMRVFGGEQISSLMTRFNMPENVPLSHSMVNRVIEQIQVKVEGFNFDIRKSLVEFDDIVDKQRGIIYKRRSKILKIVAKAPKKLSKEILEILKKEIETIVNIGLDPVTAKPDINKIVMSFCEIVPIDDKVGRGEIRKKISNLSQEEITKSLYNIIETGYKNREKLLGELVCRDIEKSVSLYTLDNLWVDHLTALEDLKEGVRLRGYGQRDPLVEYRNESFAIFQKLLTDIDYHLARRIFRVKVENKPESEIGQGVETRGQINLPGAKTEDDSTNKKVEEIKVKPVISGSSKIGRNDPCWCGSGKKWKKCHYPELS